MLRFRLGSIPVDVHFSHLAISGVIAWSMAESFRVGNWPGPILDHPTDPDFKLTYGLCIALWMTMVSLSILVHELGHALVSRAFGYRPSIQLVGLGGLTNPNANETIPWHRDVLLTLAGPLSGLALGLTAGAIGLAVGSGGPVHYVLMGLFASNLVWTVLNLLPVTSLDGGRISTALLMRIFGRRGFFFSQLLSLLVGGALVVWGMTTGSVLLAFIFGMNVVRAVTFISAYWKGELPANGPTHPFEIAFLQAQAQYAEDKLEPAGQLLKAIAEQDLQPQLRSRVHDLAGWVALKLGEGRAALDHFAQVQGLTVAPQALGAAFSLIGDEMRALPLWEQAAHNSKDPTLLHEWAGSMIRNGEVDRARLQPGVRMSLAYAAAARTWFVRKDYLKAATANEASFVEEASSERAYDAACAYALAQRSDDALRMLDAAAKAGPLRADKVEWDPELVWLRNDPRFGAWLQQLRAARRGPQAD
jgi:Zn-dependent protease